MKINQTYRSLLDKSVASMLSAIEIYNKPNFLYREDTFAILSVNAWELLLKAYILKLNKYNKKTIYELKPVEKKDGSKSTTRKQFVTNRCGNPKTISIYNAISYLKTNKKISDNLCYNLESLIELRDNSIHFCNVDPISKQIQELGFACIKNYISTIKLWEIDIDLSTYNFYLMPLAYVNEKITVDGVLSDETKNYIDLIKSKLTHSKDTNDDFDIAISIDVNFKKGNSFESIGVKYDEEGIIINLSEEDIRRKFPLTYKDVVDKCRSRYSNFSSNQSFHSVMSTIKSNVKLCNIRKLDLNNPRSMSKSYYNTNIWKELDKHYQKNI